MKPAWPPFTLAVFLAVGSTWAQPALGQSPTYRSGTVVVTPPASSVVVNQPTRREARRQARARRLAQRPVYPTNVRDPIGFAPYSDRYLIERGTGLNPR